MSTLTADQVALQLENFLPSWHLQDNCLIKTFEFKDFAGAVAFMTQLGFYCQELEHYPHLTQYYTTVSVEVGERGQHEVHGRDVQLAKRIQGCFVE